MEADTKPAGSVLRLFKCPGCGAEEYRWRGYRQPEPGELGARVKGYTVPLPVYCVEFACGSTEMEQVLVGIRHDLLREDFVIGDVDGKGERRISSLSELREIERDSEQRHRDGEGQILNFRDFSQDRGNTRSNVFEGSSYQTGKSRKPERRRTLSDLPINVRTTK